jgi:hypothetical protein
LETITHGVKIQVGNLILEVGGWKFYNGQKQAISPRIPPRMVFPFMEGNWNFDNSNTQSSGELTNIFLTIIFDVFIAC